jgi:hypothetical protein
LAFLAALVKSIIKSSKRDWQFVKFLHEAYNFFQNQQSEIRNLKIEMLLYVLIGLSLSLAGVAGLQFFYMIYLERMSNEYQKRVRELEHHNKYLTKRLTETESQITEQNELIDAFYEDFGEDDEEEIWADVIDER